MALAEFQSLLLTNIPYSRSVVAAVKILQPRRIADTDAGADRPIVRERLKQKIAGAKFWRIIEMIRVHFGHHLLYEKPRTDRELLDLGQDLFGP